MNGEFGKSRILCLLKAMNLEIEGSELAEGKSIK